jgi:ABC-type transporter Mla subunit MlaD
MSIVSEAWRAVQAGVPLSKVWDTASTKFEGWITQLANKDSTVAGALAEAEHTVKQGLSDAISVADSALGKHALPVAEAVETALERALAGATGGLSTPFNAIISAGIDDITNIAVTAAHAWAMKVKADLATAPAVAAVPAAPAAQSQA